MSSHFDLPSLSDPMDAISDMMSELSDPMSLEDLMDEDYPGEANIAYHSDSLPDLDSHEDGSGEGSSSTRSPRYDRGPSYSPLSDEDVEESHDGNGRHQSVTDAGVLGIVNASRNLLSPLEFLPTEVSTSWYDLYET